MTCQLLSYFLLLLQLCTVYASINTDILEYLNTRQLPQLSRAIRQAPPPPPSYPRLTDDERCNQNCADQMHRSLEATGVKIGNALAEAPAQALDAALYNTAAFQTFCSVYKTERTCMDRCGDSPLKTAMMNGFKSLDYVCVEKHEELLSYLPCYKNATPEFVEKCSPHCGGEDSFKEIQEELTQSQIYFDLGHSKELLGLTCELVDCQAVCESPILEKVCGSKKAADFMREFASRTMQSMVDLLSGLPSELDLVPQSCRNVANGIYGKSEILNTSEPPALPIRPESTKHLHGDKTTYYSYDEEEVLDNFLDQHQPMYSDEQQSTVPQRWKQAEEENDNPWVNAANNNNNQYAFVVLILSLSLFMIQF